MGRIIENPVTGERLTFLATAEHTGGELLKSLPAAHTRGRPWRICLMAKSCEVLHLDRNRLRTGRRRPRKRRDFFGEGRRRIRFDSQAVAMMLAETRL